jgi:hypothetical protein
MDRIQHCMHDLSRLVLGEGSTLQARMTKKVQLVVHDKLTMLMMSMKNPRWLDLPGQWYEGMKSEASPLSAHFQHRAQVSARA